MLPYDRKIENEKINQSIDITHFPKWANKINETVVNNSEKILLAVYCLISIYENDSFLKPN